MSNTLIARIRERAYLLFLARGAAPGNSEADWLQAEQEIREEEKRRHLGPARLPDSRHHGKITDESGCDLENPA